MYSNVLDNVVEEIEIPTVHFSHKKFSVKFYKNHLSHGKNIS